MNRIFYLSPCCAYSSTITNTIHEHDAIKAQNNVSLFPVPCSLTSLRGKASVSVY